MKRIVIIIFFITLIVMSNYSPKVEIPKESIRYRIIANSNSIEDQKQKWDINKELIPIINTVTKNSNDINDSRKNINTSLVEIENTVSKFTNNYNVNFGQNYFPNKTYQGVSYPEGNYESLVITIGAGQGDNWWCVLFPPLCLMEATYDNSSDINYKLYVKEILKKYN